MGYDEPDINVEMLKCGIKTYIPQKARGTKEDDGTFTRNDFKYDQEQDVYNCPNNCVLKFSSFVDGTKRYRSKTKDCRNCPLRNKCISGKGKVKTIYRPYYWTEYEIQHENDGSCVYLGVQRLRKIWCEGTFAHQKARHCMPTTLTQSNSRIK